ncbi:MAG: hypothetical protein IPF38_11230 [Burkholderiales bacterium]|nr:hypothetical protein [Burkholderiales bacterium]
MAKKADSSNNGPLTQAVLAVVLQVPDSTERMGEHPAERAHAIARSAARAASVLSGSLSLPPGIFAWLTIVPELVGVWKLQAQMVSDIAAVYGQQKTLGREQMLYCLFKHVSAQLLRDVAVRVGERVVIQQTSVTTLQKIAQQIRVQVSKRVLSKRSARFIPLLGAVSVGAYAYFDTLQVAKNATELFDRTITIDENGR